MRPIATSKHFGIGSFAAMIKEVIQRRVAEHAQETQQTAFLMAARRGYLETKGGKLLIVPARSDTSARSHKVR